MTEAATAKFLGDFERAYTELYRHRRPLYLLPLNECEVSKFVCTTVSCTSLRSVSYLHMRPSCMLMRCFGPESAMLCSILSPRIVLTASAVSVMQIRPTKLPFPDLWSLDGAVAFVANAIEYEPVENPLHPPEHLLSPQSVLAFQAGDAFDLSCLLVSILKGCGFDAYVTVGYAPADVVLNDQTNQVVSPLPATQHLCAWLLTSCVSYTTLK